MNKIKAQAGFQRKFLLSEADVTIGGGAAGVGKSFALLLDYMRYVSNPKWGGVIFRRTSPQITAEGGLWDTSEGLFTRLPQKFKPKPNLSRLSWRFPSGSNLKFSHLQYEHNKLDWQGSQIGFLGWDELTHFTRSQFFYLLTRNRSLSGEFPRTKATCNPQGQGWVKELVQWWIYPDDYPNEELAGYPIPERVGVLRYFTRYKNKMIWGNNEIEVLDQLPAHIAADYDFNSIKTLTFIPGKLEENKILMQLDPSYKGNLLAQDEETMMQLFKGRWLKVEEDRLRLYKWDALRDCFSNTFVDRGEQYMTCDIALEGADRFVICVWSGFRLERIYTYEKSDGWDVMKTIKSLAQKHGVPSRHIAIDTDGVGGAFKGFFKTAYAFHNGARPIAIDKEPQNYENLKTQCYFLLKEYVNDYKIYFDIEEEQTIDFIIEELYAVKRVETNDKKLKIVRKDVIRTEIGRSPDLADAIMMRMVFTLPKIGEKTKGRSVTTF